MNKRTKPFALATLAVSVIAWWSGLCADPDGRVVIETKPVGDTASKQRLARSDSVPEDEPPAAEVYVAASISLPWRKNRMSGRYNIGLDHVSGVGDRVHMISISLDVQDDSLTITVTPSRQTIMVCDVGQPIRENAQSVPGCTGYSFSDAGSKRLVRHKQYRRRVVEYTIQPSQTFRKTSVSTDCCSH